MISKKIKAEKSLSIIIYGIDVQSSLLSQNSLKKCIKFDHQVIQIDFNTINYQVADFFLIGIYFLSYLLENTDIQSFFIKDSRNMNSKLLHQV